MPASDSDRDNDRAEAPAALTDPAFRMPPVPAGGPAVGIRWLRRSVARFADGAEHERRRRRVVGILAGVDVAGARRLAAERTRAVLDEAGGRPVDLMTRVAREVPVGVLTAALGTPSVPAAAVGVVAAAYQPGSGAEEPADLAVAELVEALGAVPDDDTVATISLLVQAYAATAGLLGNAAAIMLRAPASRPVDTVVSETLRLDPPVRLTRRLAPGGTEVTIDLAAAGVPFGAGPHRCPGSELATAITAGVLEGVQGRRPGDGDAGSGVRRTG